MISSPFLNTFYSCLKFFQTLADDVGNSRQPKPYRHHIVASLGHFLIRRYSKSVIARLPSSLLLLEVSVQSQLQVPASAPS